MNTVVIDAIGLCCPLPLIQLQQQLEQVAVGTELLLLADDPATLDDLPFWCQQTGHRLLGIDSTDSMTFKIRVQKAAVTA